MGFHRPDLHTLAGAHALHALEEADWERFGQHLARCETCVQELRGMREAIVRLGTAAAIGPRAGLKEQILGAAALTRQLPPLPR